MYAAPMEIEHDTHISSAHQALVACRHQLVGCMDSQTRAAWRRVCRQTCQDVFEASHCLSWLGGQAFSVRERVTNPQLYRPASLPIELMSKLERLERLSCQDVQSLTSLDGLPSMLLSLDLSGCSGIADYKPLGRCTTLHHLTLDFGLPLGGDPDHLAQVLQQITTLRSLQLNSRAFGQQQQEDAVRALADALPALTQLTQLRAPGMWQHASGATVVGAALAQLSGLVHLDLSCNELGGAAARALASALSAMPRLRELNLAHSHLTYKDFQASALGEALSGCHELLGLSLEGNALRNEGAEALLPLLRALPRLQHLNVRYCQLATHGNRVLQGLAADTPGLEVLL